jgi:hypothetical protein
VTPLFCAAYYGKPECVQLLLERGADKEAKSIVRAPHTRATAAARCVGARRVCRSVGRGLRSANSRAVSASAARAGLPPRGRAFCLRTLRARGASRRCLRPVFRSFGAGERRALRPTAATRALRRRRAPRLLRRLSAMRRCARLSAAEAWRCYSLCAVARRTG